MAARSLTLSLLLAVLPLGSVRAADDGALTPAEQELLKPRTYRAARVAPGAIHVDGALDEPAWATAPEGSGFIQNRPAPGHASRLHTTFRVLYDDQALYVGVWMDDPEPARILAPLGRRDDESTSDWTFVEIDSRHDRRSAFSLGVNPAGMQVDGVFFDDTNYDSSWNGIWETATRITERGWQAEYRIPFSQLAFHAPHDGEPMAWGFNVYRSNPRTGESSNWSPRTPELGGVVSRFNDMILEPPAHQHRLEISPYVSPQLDHDLALPVDRRTHLGVHAGADLTAGITPDLMLTATVLPDFGQVEADPTQINLTTYELFFQERRPFFTEGIDAFTFDTSLPLLTRGNSFNEEAPFYSRRLGRPLHLALPDGAIALDVPRAAQLLGAAKLSGRTENGWRIGVLGAATGAERALIRKPGTGEESIAVEPAGQSGVARISRESRDGTSAVGVFLSAHHHSRGDGALASSFVDNAWTGGADGRLRWSDQTYEARAWVLGTALSGTPEAISSVAARPWHNLFRTDAPRLAPAPGTDHLDGAAGELRLSKIGGALQGLVAVRGISPGFDTNGLGFQRNSDWLLFFGQWLYQRFPHDRFLRSWKVGSDNLGLGWSWGGERRAAVVNGYGQLNFANFWDARLTLQHEFDSLSTEWFRGGPALRLPPRETAKVSIHTDTRKASYGGLDASVALEPQSDSSDWSVSPSATLRLSDHVVLNLGPSYEDQRVGWQYVETVTSAASPQYVVAHVRQRTLSLSLQADVAFTPHLVLQLYAQPFLSLGRYGGFQRLADARASRPGDRLVPLSADEAALDGDALNLALPGAALERLPNPAGAQHTLTASAVLRWEFRPGSYLTAVWSHQGDAFAVASDAPLGPQVRRSPWIPGADTLLLKLNYLWML